MKFLIIRFSSIGDIVLTTPVVRCLKKQVKGAEIHFLLKESFRPVVQGNPYLDKVHILTGDWSALMRELKKEDFDYIIDLHHNLRSWRVKSSLKKKSFAFNKLNIEKYILTAFKINLLPRIHIVDRYLKTVSSFGVLNDGEGLDFFIPEGDRVERDKLPSPHRQKGFIVCAIGAGHGTKKLPVHKWKAFCGESPLPVILLGGEEDFSNGYEIAGANTEMVYNGCGLFNISQSADIIRQAKAVVSNDTGLMHIAAAFKKPLVSLWGNTVPAFGMYPYYGKNYMSLNQTFLPYEILETTNLRCRPCSKIGYKKCPRGHFHCMERINVNDIISSVKQKI